MKMKHKFNNINKSFYNAIPPQTRDEYILRRIRERGTVLDIKVRENRLDEKYYNPSFLYKIMNEQI